MKLISLFILADLEAGGAQGVILAVIRHLNRQNFEPHLGIIKNVGPRAKEITNSVHIHDLKVNSITFYEKRSKIVLREDRYLLTLFI